MFTIPQENKYTMYVTVDDLLNDNAAKTAKVVALGPPITKFKELVGTIGGKAKEYDGATTGKTKVKNDAEDALLDELMPALGGLAAYAHDKGDVELEMKASFPESGYRRLRDTEIVPKANGHLELLQAHVAELADYGVTQATLDAIRQEIDAYSAALGGRNSSSAEKGGTRKAIIALFDEADVLLEKRIDNLIEYFRKRDPEFYQQYWIARVIKDLRGGGPRGGNAGTPPPAAPDAPKQ